MGTTGTSSSELVSSLFDWDGTRLAEHVHSSGTTSTWEYQPGSATPIAQVDQDEVDRRFYAIVADVVGSPTELVDARGEVGWRRTSTLWGRTLAQAGGAACPLRFPGQYHDPETGWHYNHFRYYDPETRRYASPDPAGTGAVGQPRRLRAQPHPADRPARPAGLRHQW
ncbi:RHS repeat-associated core domain-containing protein [Saccharothrix sp. HUAS TT1]|uniref:RHS repeat-associated core domain-containing protein n=1 Tax=unclassified Saccharothrix TaxID=2593673 RepID=UPI00345B8ECD